MAGVLEDLRLRLSSFGSGLWTFCGASGWRALGFRQGECLVRGLELLQRNKQMFRV